MTSTKERTTVLTAVLVAAALSLGLAACSSTETPDTTTTAADGLGARWGACIRDAGFEIDDPSDAVVESGTVPVPFGVDQDAYERAAAGCADQLGVRAKSQAEQQSQDREYDQVASCIREEYPDFPEQEPGSVGWDDDYAPAKDPAFLERNDYCMQKYSPDTQSMPLG